MPSGSLRSGQSAKNNTPNMAIGCTVSQCQYHCNQQDYCSLQNISVGTHEQNPKVCECVDCESFKVSM